MNDSYYENFAAPTPNFNVKKNANVVDYKKGRAPMDYNQDMHIPPSSSAVGMQVPQSYTLKSSSSGGYHPNTNMRSYNPAMMNQM